MIKRLLPALLLLSACEGQVPTGPESQTTVTESSYVSRDPVMSGAKIVQFQSLGASDVLVLDGTRTLYHVNVDSGSSVPIQNNVGWFVATQGSFAPMIWIKDLQNNLYQWNINWSPNGGTGNNIAWNVGVVKLGGDGYPFWVQNGALHGWGAYGLNGGLEVTTVDGGNVADFFPANDGATYDIGTDGKLWWWYFDGSRTWQRIYVDGNALAAQPGCFYNLNGECHDLVLGTDRKLWTESNQHMGAGHGPNPVDTNVLTFEGVTTHYAFIEEIDRNLYRQNLFTGQRDWVDGNVWRFEAARLGLVTAWVQGYDGKLWREHLSSSLP
jgi:hypothetical protein